MTQNLPTVDVTTEPIVYRNEAGEPVENPGLGYYTRTYHVTMTAVNQTDADEAFAEFEAMFDHSGDIAIGHAEDDVQDGIVIYGSSFEPEDES